jgi:deoxyribonuclease (pyrimidine dimer)
MTRINSAIIPSFLTDQHLIAELRELPRIFTLVKKRKQSGIDIKDAPKSFTLGKGHVKFFYDKLSFLQKRHKDLRDEYNSRYSKEWQYIIDGEYTGEYIPTEKEHDLLVCRISERLLTSKQQPRFVSKSITKKEVISKLTTSSTYSNK